MSTATLADPNVETEAFSGPWPAVLLEMKDFVDLWFLAKPRHAATLRIFISRTAVPPGKLQPHVRAFKAALGSIAGCVIELKGTEEAAHRIEIEYRRPTP